MIIEFYGLPGSGKTTLAKNLIQKNPEKFIYFHTSPRREIIKYGFLFFLSQLKIFFFWFKELFLEGFKKYFFQLFRYKLHLLLITLAQYQKAKKYSSKIILLDEGLFQRILTIYGGKLDERKIKECFGNIPKVDLLVLVQNPEKEFFRFKNSIHREESPRVKLGEKYLSQWMVLSRVNDKMIRDFIKTQNIKFIEVDGKASLDICLNKIESEIAELEKIF